MKTDLYEQSLSLVYESDINSAINKAVDKVQELPNTSILSKEQIIRVISSTNLLERNDYNRHLTKFANKDYPLYFSDALTYVEKHGFGNLFNNRTFLNLPEQAKDLLLKDPINIEFLYYAVRTNTDLKHMVNHLIQIRNAFGMNNEHFKVFAERAIRGDGNWMLYFKNLDLNLNPPDIEHVSKLGTSITNDPNTGSIILNIFNKLKEMPWMLHIVNLFAMLLLIWIACKRYGLHKKVKLR